MATPDGQFASSNAPSSRPASQKSGRSSRSSRSHPSSRTTEQTPLLANEDRSHEDEHIDEEEIPETPATASLLQSLIGTTKEGKFSSWKKRWPSIVALVLLCIAVILIMLGFLATEGVEEYAMQAADFKPTKLSLGSLTHTGAKIHVEGDFRMDASKVEKSSVRNLGRFGTWIAHEVESGPTDVDVYLPEYGNVLLGTARIPGIKVNVRNGKTTHVSFDADVEPGSLEGIRNIANDWIDGRLGQIRVKGKAEVPLKSGLIRLGKQTIEKFMIFQGNDVPSLPAYNISKINIHEAKDGNKGMGADAEIDITNQFPLQLTLPPVAVDVLVDGCQPSDKHIMVGTAETPRLDVEPHTDLHVNVTGNVEELPDSLTAICPDSAKSPLDSLLGDYMHGDAATVYINCCKFPDPDTPSWARDLLKDITVPVPFAGKDMGNLIKNFSLADVHFSLPDMFADPDSPEASPKISAIIKVDINLPKEMNFPLDVDGVKADADIYYHNKKFGKLNLKKWQKANSTMIDANGDESASLLVEAQIKDAPIDVLDYDVFSEIIQSLLGGSKPVMLDIKAAVSVKVDTPMGSFAVREIPAEGVVPVKPIGHGNGDGDGDKAGFNKSALNLQMGNLSIIDTTRTSITIGAMANLTNPTNYSATVPYVNINILVNDTIVGQAVGENISVHPGNNTNIAVKIVWDPFTHSGDKGKAIGAEFLSQYVSGFNTSLTLQAHNGTIPAQPGIGFVLSSLPITFPTPRLNTPKKPNDGDGDNDPDNDPPSEDGKTHFIRGATMHIISSTAIFTLSSPFSSTTLFITSLNATSYYDGHPSGKILYDLPFAVPPGLSDTPRLPVDWSIGSIGYEAIKKALGGTLQLSAIADVGIRIGQWREQIWYKGGKIGAHVRL
ncbi:hypothetical protein BU24DRAFT_394790 [Aaosphaeria arxii CBS 175.79]|uniref:Pre-rRNA processing protein n=1 Tax=Aaosphaeria arxii CBS 175.79 TaxID=1450172 RepID=A0A6A5XLK5_9PLEO|nr:uncharacterized protein BU24DRAFT_394790 [Aaosphaeria arxii CBS 175.79]KAF2013776.1 hypothetical protein BU24DRAFT_394790 [Aaosphaeria arxii CBS 175.79]